jgi:hypothetical protein
MKQHGGSSNRGSNGTDNIEALRVDTSEGGNDGGNGSESGLRTTSATPPSTWLNSVQRQSRRPGVDRITQPITPRHLSNAERICQNPSVPETPIWHLRARQSNFFIFCPQGTLPPFILQVRELVSHIRLDRKIFRKSEDHCVPGQDVGTDHCPWSIGT